MLIIKRELEENDLIETIHGEYGTVFFIEGKHCWVKFGVNIKEIQKNIIKRIVPVVLCV